jgi:methionyl-tRNA synthetase
LNDSIDYLDINTDEFVNRINSELVNNITNLTSRTVGFLNKRLESRLGSIPPDVGDLMASVTDSVEAAKDYYLKLLFGQATKEILKIADLANGFVQERAPWSAIKDDPERARNELTFVVNCIKIITVLLKPIIPSYCEKVQQILGLRDLTWDDAKFDLENCAIGQFEKLADRLEAGVMEKMIEASSETFAADGERGSAELPEFKQEITIDDFGGVDLRAGKVITAEDVPGSDKLLKLEVDLGLEQRTVFAGIKSSYKPADLLGLTVVVVANLKPRKMRFGLSQGMILAAEDGAGKVRICELPDTVVPGTPIR